MGGNFKISDKGSLEILKKPSNFKSEDAPFAGAAALSSLN